VTHKKSISTSTTRARTSRKEAQPVEEAATEGIEKQTQTDDDQARPAPVMSSRFVGERNRNRLVSLAEARADAAETRAAHERGELPEPLKQWAERTAAYYSLHQKPTAKGRRLKAVTVAAYRLWREKGKPWPVARKGKAVKDDAWHQCCDELEAAGFPRPMELKKEEYRRRLKHDVKAYETRMDASLRKPADKSRKR
jgi:hypothetical protein